MGIWGWGFYKRRAPLHVNGKEIDRKWVKCFGISVMKDGFQCCCGEIGFIIKSNSPSVVTQKETGGLESLAFENVGARFLAFLLVQISLQLF